MDPLDTFFRKIEALQKRPVYVRKRILVIATGVSSTLVFFLWLSIFPATLERAQRNTAQTASGTSPFAALTGAVREAGKGLSEIGDSFGEQIRYVREHPPEPEDVLEGLRTEEAVSTSSLPTATPKDLEE